MIESSVINRKNFGHVYELRNGDEFLDTVDNQDNSDVLIVIHIWDKASEACKTINEGLQTISKEYNYIKFCRIQVFFFCLKIKIICKHAYYIYIIEISFTPFFLF